MITKRYASFALAFLTACAPSQAQVTPSPAATKAPTQTAAPSPAPTTTPAPTPTATPWPIPSNVIFCLDQAGSAADQTTIKESIRTAHQYFAEHFGAEPGPVVVFAGPDIQQLASQGECGDSPLLRRARGDLRDSWAQTGGYALFGLQITNTSYSVWKTNRDFRKDTVAHEYAHQLQMTLMGRAINGADAGPLWLIEGSAEVIAAASQGSPPLAGEAIWWVLKTNVPPEVRLGVEGSSFYDLSRLAVSYLIAIAPKGEQSIVDYFVFKPTASTWKLAFQKAFARTPEQFEGEFEAFRITNP